MKPTKELIDELRRDKTEQARRMTFEEKFLAGGELFDYACELTKAGIRWQHPDWTEQQVLEELRRRIDLRTRREDETAHRVSHLTGTL
jgi:hypothetical protein